MVPPTTLVCALSAKRPKPPPGSGRWPAQRSVSRSDVASAASVPSILQRRPVADIAVEGELERRAGEPQLQAGAVAAQRGEEIGEAERRVERLVVPDEAAGRAEALRDRRPGERELDVRQRLDDLAAPRRAACTVPSVDADFRERRAARFGLGCSVRASVSMWPDQFELPSASNATVMGGRTSDTSAISIRPISSGKKRSRTTSCSAVSAACRCGCRRGSRRRSSPCRSETARPSTSPRRTGSRPVTARICGLDRVAHRVGRDQQRQRPEAAPNPDREHGRDGKAKALDAGGRGHEASFRWFGAEAGDDYSEGDRGCNLAPVCVAFVAGYGVRGRYCRAFRRGPTA